MANQVTSTVTKAVAQNGQTLASASYTIAGIQCPALETTVAVATPLIIADGIGTLAYANLNMLYMLSDALDCTVKFYTGTDGTTGLITTITIQAGIPYEWDSGTNPLGTSNAASVKITATNFIKGVASGGTPTSTDVHFRTSLTG